MVRRWLLLGVDGGGTSCRARLADLEGQVLGEGLGGPANIRFGLEESFAAVLEAAEQCLDQAGLVARRTRYRRLPGAGRRQRADPPGRRARACASVPSHAVITTDAHAACVGAHGGATAASSSSAPAASAGAVVGGTEYRVGGWGFPISDEGSGAWLGCEAARRVLWAHDGRMPWTRSAETAVRALRWRSACDRALDGAGASARLCRAGAARRGARCARRRCGLRAHARRCRPHRRDRRAPRGLGVPRIALIGRACAAASSPGSRPTTRELLVAPQGDALSGALQLARQEAETIRCAQAAIERG